ncbi:MAG: indolepyruvate oxidoreductase subunit beta [Muribaculaceae bacterium]|nr:indolepyruvate oxidoreductase subunit beta [Muribaculaceae bacterium]
MKTDIVLAGVGGQGILSIANVIGVAALKDNLFLKQAEVHGMSQRGGDVQSNLRISSEPISSDLIPLNSADIVVSLEPMEALRYMPYLKKTGWLVTNTTPFINIDNYPSVKELLQELEKTSNLVAFDMDEIAKQIGSPRSSNMVLLGAASPFTGIPVESLEEGIKEFFAKKGEKICKANLDAFRAGREETIEFLTERNKDIPL